MVWGAEKGCPPLFSAGGFAHLCRITAYRDAESPCQSEVRQLQLPILPPQKNKTGGQEGKKLPGGHTGGLLLAHRWGGTTFPLPTRAEQFGQAGEASAQCRRTPGAFLPHFCGVPARKSIGVPRPGWRGEWRSRGRWIKNLQTWVLILPPAPPPPFPAPSCRAGPPHRRYHLPIYRSRCQPRVHLGPGRGARPASERARGKRRHLSLSRLALSFFTGAGRGRAGKGDTHTDTHTPLDSPG